MQIFAHSLKESEKNRLVSQVDKFRTLKQKIPEVFAMLENLLIDEEFIANNFRSFERIFSDREVLKRFS